MSQVGLLMNGGLSFLNQANSDTTSAAVVLYAPSFPPIRIATRALIIRQRSITAAASSRRR